MIALAIAIFTNAPVIFVLLSQRVTAHNYWQYSCKQHLGCIIWSALWYRIVAHGKMV